MYRLLRELQLTLSQCFKMCTPVFTVLETESPDSNRTPGCQVDDTGRTRAQDEPCATLCFVSGNPGNSENNESQHTGRNKNKCSYSGANISKENKLSIVVGEASVSTWHVSQISDDIYQGSFYDLVVNLFRIDPWVLTIPLKRPFHQVICQATADVLKSPTHTDPSHTHPSLTHPSHTPG